jgi:hypothetical protein
MATFSSRSPHIPYMLFEKSYDIILGFWSKLFRKFSSFLVQKFSNLFFWNDQLKILRMPPFILFKYVLVLFLRSCLYSESYFLQRNYGSGEIHRSPLYSRITKKYLTETCQIGKPTHPPFKICFINLMKINFSFDVLKFRFFSKFSILT